MCFFVPLIITSLLASLAATSPSQLESDHLNLDLSSVSSGSYRSNQTALTDQNITVPSSKNGNPIIFCDGQKYQHDLNLKCCEDAVSRISSSHRNTISVFVAVRRSMLGCHNALSAVRLCSSSLGPCQSAPDNPFLGDGLCIIDVVLKDDVERAAAAFQ